MQHPPGSGRWTLSVHGWTSKGARVCSGQRGQDRVLSDTPAAQMDTTWARLAVQKWETGFAFHSALIATCVFHRGARVLSPMAAGTPKCPRFSDQASSPSSPGRVSRPRPVLLLGQELGPAGKQIQ